MTELTNSNSPPAAEPKVGPGASAGAPAWRFTPTWIEALCLIAGQLLVFWYAWIMDDAYVYFRYVDNLLINGAGLVWNSGEFVEGFSSPLWAIFLAAARALHLNYWLVIRLGGMIFFALFWYLACLVNRRLSPPGLRGTDRQLNLPLVYLCFTYAVLCYFTSGLEGPMINVSAALFALAALTPGGTLLQAAVGVTPLVRHEFALPFLLFLAFAWWRERRFPLPAFLSALVTTGGYLLFRVWYYADLFPNTFYLKNEVWISQGGLYVLDTVLPYHTIPFLLAALLLYLLQRRTRGPGGAFGPERGFMLLSAVMLAGYVVKIGGDPRHFRYLAFPYILAVLGTGGLAEGFVDGWRPSTRRLVPAILVTFAVLTASLYPRQNSWHPVRHNFVEYHPSHDHEQLWNINDAVVHRFSRRRHTPAWYDAGAGLSWGAAVDRLRGALEPGVVRLSLNCKDAYLEPANPYIHGFGLTEPFLARTEMISNRPAHKKGLYRFGYETWVLRRMYGFRSGAFALARPEDGFTDWIEPNLPVLERIEQQVYNRHDLLENLRLALTPAGRVIP